MTGATRQIQITVRAGNQPAAISGALQGAHVDRVQYETHDGRARMKLIKYCSGSKAKA